MAVTLFCVDPTSGRGRSITVSKERVNDYIPDLKIENKTHLHFSLPACKGIDIHKVERLALKVIYNDQYKEDTQAHLLQYYAGFLGVTKIKAHAEQRLLESLTNKQPITYIRNVLQAALIGRSEKLTIICFRTLMQNHGTLALENLLETSPFLREADTLVSLALRIKAYYEEELRSAPSERTIQNIREDFDNKHHMAYQALQNCLNVYNQRLAKYEALKTEIQKWKEDYNKAKQEQDQYNPAHKLLKQLNNLDNKEIQNTALQLITDIPKLAEPQVQGRPSFVIAKEYRDTQQEMHELKNNYEAACKQTQELEKQKEQALLRVQTIRTQCLNQQLKPLPTLQGQIQSHLLIPGLAIVETQTGLTLQIDSIHLESQNSAELLDELRKIFQIKYSCIAGTKLSEINHGNSIDHVV